MSDLEENTDPSSTVQENNDSGEVSRDDVDDNDFSNYYDEESDCDSGSDEQPDEDISSEKDSLISHPAASGDHSSFFPPISDAQVSSVAGQIPLDVLQSMACEGLSLTDDQSDNAIVNSNILKRDIADCLKLGLDRQNIRTCAELNNCLELAVQCDSVSLDVVQIVSQNTSLNAINDELLLELSPFMLHNNASFLEKVLCLTRDEIDQMLPSTLRFQKITEDLVYLWRKQKADIKSGMDLVNALKKTRLSSEALGSIKKMLGYSDVDGEAVNQIVSVLKYCYTNDYKTICPLPWVEGAEQYSLDDVLITLYVENQTVSCLEQVKDRHNTTSGIPITDMFSTSTEKRHKRIILHGEPGCGKSMLAAKLAWDWAKGDVPYLKDFQLVFVIRVCLLTSNDSLFDYLRRQYYAPVNDAAWQECKEEIQNSSTLLIFDGYDEQQTRSDVVKHIIDRDMRDNYTILVTSRYGATEALVRSVDFEICYCLRKLTSTDVQQFIANYAKDETQTALSKRYAQQDLLADIFATPLYLWFYVLLGEEYFCDTKPFTRTYFFNQVIKGILAKAKERFHLLDPSLLDLRMFSLQAMAYNCLCEQRLQITLGVDSIDDDTQKLGFLKKMVSSFGAGTNVVYMFPHKTILEYLCAKHIIDTYKDEKDMMSKLQRLKELDDPHKRAASMLLPFLVGLLNDKQHEGLPHPQVILMRYTLQELQGSHSHHAVLQCIAECAAPVEFSYEFLSSAIGNETKVDYNCTSFCMRGINVLRHHYSLDRFDYSSYHNIVWYYTVTCDSRYILMPQPDGSSSHCVAMEVNHQVPVAYIRDGKSLLNTFLVAKQLTVTQLIMHGASKLSLLEAVSIFGLNVDNLTSLYVDLDLNKNFVDIANVASQCQQLKHMGLLQFEYTEDYSSFSDTWQTIATQCHNLLIVEYHSTLRQASWLLHVLQKNLTAEQRKALPWEALYVNVLQHGDTFEFLRKTLHSEPYSVLAVSKSTGDVSYSEEKCLSWYDLGEKVGSAIHSSEEGRTEKCSALHQINRLKTEGCGMADEVVDKNGWSSEEYIYMYGKASYCEIKELVNLSQNLTRDTSL